MISDRDLNDFAACRNRDGIIGAGTEAERLKRGVSLCGEDKIALRQAVDLVRPESDLHFTPREIDIGVVALSLGDLS